MGEVPLYLEHRPIPASATARFHTTLAYAARLAGPCDSSISSAHHMVPLTAQGKYFLLLRTWPNIYRQGRVIQCRVTMPRTQQGPRVCASSFSLPFPYNKRQTKPARPCGNILATATPGAFFISSVMACTTIVMTRLGSQSSVLYLLYLIS